MQLGDEERAILAEVARGRGVSGEALARAVEGESAAELARASGIDRDTAGAWMDRVGRIVAVEGDWGAGCMLLTDELRAELHDELRRLPPAHSASSGDSQG